MEGFIAGRRTGRTTALLERAIREARDGEDVLVAMVSRAMCIYAIDRVKVLTANQCEQTTELTLEFGSGGKIRFWFPTPRVGTDYFEQLAQYDRGRDGFTFIDHAYTEQILRHLEKVPTKKKRG